MARKSGDLIGARIDVLSRWRLGRAGADGLDVMIAYAMMGINVAKGVEIGAG